MASQIRFHEPVPKRASTSGNSFKRSFWYCWLRHPVTMRSSQTPVFLYSLAWRIVSIDSCFAFSINVHVLTIMMFASERSSVISMWWSRRIPSITSVSMRFFEHPKLTNPIFFMYYSFPNRIVRIHQSCISFRPSSVYIFLILNGTGYRFRLSNSFGKTSLAVVR